MKESPAVAIKVYAALVADKMFPVVKRLAGVSTLRLLGFAVVFYLREFVAISGSYAIGAEVLFVLGIALVSYQFGFGLNRGQRSAMALAMGMRIASGVFAACTAFLNPDPRTSGARGAA